MSYPLSNEAKSLFTSNAYQLLRVTMSTSTGEVVITSDDVEQNTFSIDRYSITGSNVELGSCTSAELSFTIKNNSSQYNDVLFEGAEMYVEVGVSDDTNTYYIPMGYYTVDNSPRYLSSIDIVALDRMVQFDKYVDIGENELPISLSMLATLICERCNVDISVGTPVEVLLNGDYEIDAIPNDADLTYRQLLMWVCEIGGACAYIDWDGKLRFAWYENDVTETIDESDRYITSSNDILEKPIIITGVQIESNETYLVGEEGYVINIQDNQLITHDYETVLQTLGAKLIGFEYYPYSAQIIPYINLYPFDRIAHVKDGKSVSTIVTNTNFTLNGKLVIMGKGESTALNEYAKLNPLTAREKIIIKQETDSIINAELDGRLQDVISLNELIAGSMGLYTTIITNEDGSKTSYYHSNPVLENSIEGDAIYSWQAQGFAWTRSGWNSGSPVWQYGFTADGNAVLSAISAYKIDAKYISGEFIMGDELRITTPDASFVVDEEGIHFGNFLWRLRDNGNFSLVYSR